MNSILKRLKEKSTYAGLVTLLASLGVLGLQESEWQMIFGAVAAVAGAASIFFKEKTVE